MGLLNATLDAIDAGRLGARIEFVFCNRARGEAEGSDAFMARVESRGVPLISLSSRKFRELHGGRRWSDLRQSYDLAALDLLAGFSPAISVAAGYMLIAPELCRKFRMINLHPALPEGPIGTWQKVIWDLIDQGAAESGALINVVTEDVDAGPVLTCCRFPIRSAGFDPHWADVKGRTADEIKSAEGEEFPLFQAIRHAGVLRERPLLVETLIEIAEGRLSPDAPPVRPLDLTGNVEKAVTRATLRPS
ncbi:MAG: hypothetical protein HY678_07335 [Chloroflexi bacterium]|nr:hypothetical protein [Chloroflexota bacterium]